MRFPKSFAVTLFLLFFTLSYSCPNIKITEVMYNPPGNDNYGEFFEICNLDNQTFNLTNFSISGVKTNLSGIFISPKECVVFCKTKNRTGSNNDFFDIYNVSLSFYNQTYTYKGYLNNDNFSLKLFYNNILIDSFLYNNSLANGNGLSLNKYNDTIFEDKPSPFYYNFTYYNTTSQFTNLTEDKTNTKINSTEDFTNNSQTNKKDNIRVVLIRIVNNTLFYRILSNHSYLYWFEDPYGNIIKTPRKSNTTYMKRFSTKEPFVYLVAKSLLNNKTDSIGIKLNQSQKFISSLKKYSNNKIKLLLKITFFENDDFTIVCKLNSKEVFSYMSLNKKPVVNSNKEFVFFLPSEFLKSGKNKLICLIQANDITKSVRYDFTWRPKIKNTKIRKISQTNCENKKKTSDFNNPKTVSNNNYMSSFYTLDKYFKQKNHFFITFNKEFLNRTKRLIYIYELRKILMVNDSLLNTSKNRIDFYLSVLSANTTLLATVNQTNLKFLKLNLTIKEKEVSNKEDLLSKEIKNRVTESPFNNKKNLSNGTSLIFKRDLDEYNDSYSLNLKWQNQNPKDDNTFYNISKISSSEIENDTEISKERNEVNFFVALLTKITSRIFSIFS